MTIKQDAGKVLNNLFILDIERTRSQFFKRIRRSSLAEIKALQLELKEGLWRLRLDEDTKNKIYSLQAMHIELMKELAYSRPNISSTSTMEYIKLLSDNQWINAFYGENSAQDAKNLRDSMTKYARALGIIEINKTRYNVARFLATMIIALALALLIVIWAITANDLILSLIGTQMTCIGITWLALVVENNRNYMNRDTVYQELSELKLSEKFDNQMIDQTAQENKVNPQLMHKHISDLIEELETKLKRSLEFNNSYGQEFELQREIPEFSAFLDNFIGNSGSFHAFKDVDTKIYAETCGHLRELDAAHHRETKYSHIFTWYIITSLFATALVALSIALSHTNFKPSLAGGIMLGCILGVVVLCGVIVQFGEPPSPTAINKNPIIKDKIDALKQIRTELGNKLPLDKTILYGGPPPAYSEGSYPSVLHLYPEHSVPVVQDANKKYNNPIVLNDGTNKAPTPK